MADDLISRRRQTGRRSMLLAGLAALAAGTAGTAWPGTLPGTLRIRRISVSTEALKSYSVRGLPIPQRRFATDLEAAVKSRLGAQFTRSGEAELEISATQVLLRTPEQSLLSPAPSVIEAVISVRHVRDGRMLLQPARIRGPSGRLRMIGLIGAVTAPKPQKDYRDTLTGFAREVQETLFGGPERR